MNGVDEWLVRPGSVLVSGEPAWPRGGLDFRKECSRLRAVLTFSIRICDNRPLFQAG